MKNREDLMCFFDVDGSEHRTKRAGVAVKALTGQAAQLCFIRLDPGTATDHTHESEQIGYILVGAAEVTVGDVTRLLHRGDGYIIPPHVRHAFTVVSDAPLEVVEVFCPPKTENAGPVRAAGGR